jgi:hypothetical protein
MEGEKFWALEKRLATWHKNQKFDKPHASAEIPQGPVKMGNSKITFTPIQNAAN